MKYITTSIALSCLIVLCGCSVQTAKEKGEVAFQKLTVPGAALDIPSVAIIRPTADINRQIADTDLNENDLDKPAEYRIAMKLLSSPCSSNLTGASDMQPKPDMGGDTQWGRFTDSDMTVGGGYPDSICFGSTYVSEECASHKEPFQFCDSGSRNYALCSEKDGKTVVICLKQAKDDPKQVEEIFKTFRWIE